MNCKCDKCGGKITGLAHIGIKVKDIDASIRFYVDTLGFTLTNDQQLGASRLAFLNIGTCLIELIQSGGYEERTAGQIDHIAVEVEDIDTLVCKLIEKQVKFLTDGISDVPNLLGGVRNIFFTGPDGERFEFFEYVNR